MNRPHSVIGAFVAALAALVAALPAAAQFAKSEDAIEYRQAVMTVMNAHMGRLGAMVQGKVPFDAKAALGNANIVATMLAYDIPQLVTFNVDDFRRFAGFVDVVNAMNAA